MAHSSSNTLEYVKTGGYIILGLLGIGVVKNLAEAFGILDSKEKKYINDVLEDANMDSTKIQDQSNPFIAFNPNYASAIVASWQKKYPGQVWNTAKQAKFSQTDYKTMADQIAKAPGFFNDDEDVLYSVFRRIQTQWQLSLLSSFFTTFHKKDLLLFLKSFLGEEEFSDLLKIIKPYPQYYQ